MENKKDAETKKETMTMKYKNGEEYTGEVKGDQKHGHGIYKWPDGRVYEGEFKNDKIEGEGVCDFPNGDKYEGHFAKEYFDGFGIMTLKNGVKYEGNWSKGIKEGKGILTLPDGRKYDGEFKDDKINGKGKFNFPDGSVYEGEFKDEAFYGEGHMTFADGRVYEGEWRDGRMNGHGRLYVNTEAPEVDFSNGSYDLREYFEGEWENGKPKGVYTRMFGALPYTFLDGKPYLDYNSIDNKAAEGTKAVYINHSGFWVQMPSATLVFDWYLGALPPTRKDKKVIVFISHRHGDHYNPAVFQIGKKRKDVTFIFGTNEDAAEDIQLAVDREITDNGLDDEDYITAKVITGGETFTMKNPEVKIETLDASKTDLGVAFLIEIDGKTIYHSGDLAVINAKTPQTLDNDTMEKLGEELAKQLFPEIIGRKIDFAMLAMDPRFQYCGEVSLLSYLKAADIKVFAPIHLWGKYDYPQQFAKDFPDYAKEKMIMPYTGEKAPNKNSARQVVKVGEMFDPFA